MNSATFNQNNKNNSVHSKKTGKVYSSRYEEIFAEIPEKEAVRLIEEVYHSQADLDNSNFDIWDQLLACESVAESTPIKQFKLGEKTSESASVNGVINDTCKRKVNFELSKSKHDAISNLKKCTYKTPPIEIAQLLEQLFTDYPSKEGHWLYVAQHWTPRAINRVIDQMIKRHTSGIETIKNPAAYFTIAIKFRKKRKI